MSVRSRALTIVWIRRVVQIGFFLLFLGIVLAGRGVDGRLPGGLGFFFDIDPLVFLATWIASHSVGELSLLFLATVAVTLLLGRVFCGWVCPLGALHNSLSWLKLRRKALRARTDGYNVWQRAKYVLLIALLLMSLFGAHWIGVFDPAALLYRSLAMVVLPAVQYVAEDGSTAIYQSDPRIGPLRLTDASEPVYELVRDGVFSGQRHVFTGTTLILFIFVAALALNLWRPRFWCRFVCPLGALLGLISGRTTMRLQSLGGCNSCMKCTMNCPAAADPDKPGEWRANECFGCWNCVTACDNGAIDFKFEPFWKRPVAAKLDLGRRRVVGALAGGLGGLFLLRTPPQARGRTYNPELIRPPGSLPERDFLERCISCGACMKVCPTNALHPAFAQAGLEGVWTPVLVPRLGYCEFECNLCGQICPTGAIAPLPVAEKKIFVMGLAYFDTDRCLPYAYDRECIVCEEHCPIPTKAIYFTSQTRIRRDGSTVTLKMPRVDASLCTGCGICETKCPFRDQAAIRVTSAGETRNPDNRPILQSADDFDFGSYDESADPYAN